MTTLLVTRHSWVPTRCSSPTHFRVIDKQWVEAEIGGFTAKDNELLTTTGAGHHSGGRSVQKPLSHPAFNLHQGMPGCRLRLLAASASRCVVRRRSSRNAGSLQVSKWVSGDRCVTRKGGTELLI